MQAFFFLFCTLYIINSVKKPKRIQILTVRARKIYSAGGPF